MFACVPELHYLLIISKIIIVIMPPCYLRLQDAKNNYQFQSHNTIFSYLLWWPDLWGDSLVQRGWTSEDIHTDNTALLYRIIHYGSYGGGGGPSCHLGLYDTLWKLYWMVGYVFPWKITNWIEKNRPGLLPSNHRRPHWGMSSIESCPPPNKDIGSPWPWYQYQLGPNHVCVILSRRRDTITSVWYYVSHRRDT